MISLEEYFGLYGLDENEVAAISEHEHIPDIAAAALASYLLTQPHGGETLRTMIIDDIHKALDEGRVGHAADLFVALRHFLDHHPEGRAGLAAEQIEVQIEVEAEVLLTAMPQPKARLGR